MDLKIERVFIKPSFCTYLSENESVYFPEVDSVSSDDAVGHQRQIPFEFQGVGSNRNHAQFLNGTRPTFRRLNDHLENHFKEKKRKGDGVIEMESIWQCCL